MSWSFRTYGHSRLTCLTFKKQIAKCKCLNYTSLSRKIRLKLWSMKCQNLQIDFSIEALTFRSWGEYLKYLRGQIFRYQTDIIGWSLLREYFGRIFSYLKYLRGQISRYRLESFEAVRAFFMQNNQIMSN